MRSEKYVLENDLFLQVQSLTACLWSRGPSFARCSCIYSVYSDRRCNTRRSQLLRREVVLTAEHMAAQLGQVTSETPPRADVELVASFTDEQQP